MLYKQCKLRGVDSARETVGWVEGWAARSDLKVKLPELGDEWFQVIDVYSSIEAKDLRAKQAADRDCFGSIAGK